MHPDFLLHHFWGFGSNHLHLQRGFEMPEVDFGRLPTHTVADDRLAFLATRMADEAFACGSFDKAVAAVASDDEAIAQRGAAGEIAWLLSQWRNT